MGLAPCRVLDCLLEPENTSPWYEFGRNKTRVGTGRNIFVPEARSAKRGVLREGDNVKLKVPKVENPKTEACFSGVGEQPGVWCQPACREPSHHGNTARPGPYQCMGIGLNRRCKKLSAGIYHNFKANNQKCQHGCG